MRNRLGLYLAAAIIMAALVGGWLGDKVSAGAPLEEDTQQLLKTFTQTLSVVESKYAREIATEELVENAVRGMLRTLDPHSSYFTRSDYNRLQEEQQGRYYGLGISIRAESPGSGRVVILEPPAPGTPAYKVGLKVGDVISKIKGEPIEDWDLNEEVIPNLKGPKGTTVDITIERPGVPEPIELTVERDEIPIYTIKYSFMIRPGIGYIAIDRFSETTGGELDEALRNLNESGLGGLILDLRNNPGGALSQAIAVSDRFLEKDQIIVSTRSRSGKDQEYKAPKGRQHTYPMVVLINESSASASEIVAGALQDHDRALIVGETSFGKALVQTIYPLHGNRGLALTTGKYYTPSDRLIQRDYAGSFYDYLYTRRSTSDAGSGEHHTDSGRAVYSGGGISPDVRVQLEPNSKLGRMIDRENLFWNFVSKLSTGGIKSDVNYDYSGQELSVEQRKQLTTEIEISENTLNLFKDYLRENKIAFSDEDFEESEELVENRLKQQLFLKLFGDKEGYKVALEIDRQVQEALGVLPRAQVLLQNSLARK